MQYRTQILEQRVAQRDGQAPATRAVTASRLRWLPVPVMSLLLVLVLLLVLLVLLLLLLLLLV
ncbi:hypothetical protein LN466_20755, partial [Xanthomonas vesicatoria]